MQTRLTRGDLGRTFRGRKAWLRRTFHASMPLSKHSSFTYFMSPLLQQSFLLYIDLFSPSSYT